MLDPGDLLEHARRVLSTAHPSEADLRRSISSAYYAVFHLLTSAAAERAAGPNASALSARFRRAVDHRHIRKVCDAIASAKGGTPKFLDGLLDRSPSASLVAVSAGFARLQDARHAADYDLEVAPTLRGSMLLLSEADDVFVFWKAIRDDPEAHVFLALFLLPDRNARRG